MLFPRLVGVKMADDASDTFGGGLKNYFGALGFILPLVGFEELVRHFVDTSHPSLSWAASAFLIVIGYPIYSLPAIWKASAAAPSSALRLWALSATAISVFAIACLLLLDSSGPYNPISVKKEKFKESIGSNASNEVSSPLCWDGPCAPVRLKPGPEYFKEIGLIVGGYEPLVFVGTSTLTTDRLRVFADFSEYRNGWMPKTRVFVGEIKEPVKGQSEKLQLIYYQKERPNAGANKLWWGEPSKEHPVTASTFDGAPLPAIIVRVRVAIVGSSGEQHHYFVLVRGGENIGTQVGVIPQHDSGDWIANWEKE